MSLVWDSNPFAYGAFHGRVDAHTSCIAGIAETDKTRGWYRGKLVYEGISFEEAQAACEREHEKFVALTSEYNPND